jgi:GlcNAc-P-P-Und epimerase
MRKILFTGGSGFLGRNIVPVFQQYGYAITSLGLTGSNDLKVDLSEHVPIFDTSYDIVIHAAGKAHSSPLTASEKEVFMSVNLKGTQNLCSALENSGLPESFVFISTVVVYGCKTREEITEEHPLNGDSTYALSKIKAEQFLQGWCAKNGVVLTILRPSLIAGKNPPGNLGAMIKGMKSGRYLSIAGGKVRRSLVMAEDIARFIPLAKKNGGIYNISDNCHPSFAQLEEIICSQLGKKRPKSIPYWLARSFAFAGDLLGSAAPINSEKLAKITTSLTFSNKKAVERLNWRPLSVLDNFRI